MKEGGAWPCALNAADEIAVAAFLQQRLPFLGIPAVIESVLERTSRMSFETIDDVLTADAEARRIATEEVSRRTVSTAVASWSQQRGR
jgi:1-deoxy-D-xylulose-5-phosphate reductoisomerase